MRLFRRSLLCLVVGVTAFGTAGWGFRPRPSWEVAMDDTSDHIADYFSPIAENTRNFDQPVWIVVHSQRGGAGESDRAKLVAFDSRTGKMLQEAPIRGEEYRCRLFDHGLQLEEHWIGTPADKESRTEFRFFQWDSQPKLAASKFSGYWRSTDDGLHAW